MTDPLKFRWFREVLANITDTPAVVGNDFGFTEGPVWVPAAATWVFSDIPRSQMWRWSGPQGQLSTLRDPSDKANGNAVDLTGALLTCQHATSRVVRAVGSGVVVVAEHYRGKRLNSPNDVVVDSDGGVLFTDPTYGLSAGFGVKRDQELSFQGVFRVSDGEVVLIDDDYIAPNGLCFSPSQDTLYVNDSERRMVYRYRYEHGRVSAREDFLKVASTSTAVPDGMKCDRFGNIWVTGAEGIRVYSADGSELGVLQHDGDDVANFAFGGRAGDELLITAGRRVIHARLSAALTVEGL